MKYGLSLSGLFLCLFAYGQWIPSINSPDTITYNHRIGGELDSVDMLIGRNSGTQPSSGLEFPFYTPSTDFFWNYKSGMRTDFRLSDPKMKFTALPHIGFAYLFGTKGTQIARMEYQQIFKRKLAVNLDFYNDRSTGFLRNGSHRLNHINFLAVKSGKMWSFRVDGLDRISFSGLNGGLSSGSDPEAFPLVFLPVNKENASSESRISNLKLTNYFDFNKDSLNAFGLLTEHQLYIRKRTYTEDDALYLLYDQINIDSNSTQDKYQFSKVLNGFGAFIKNKNLYASASFNHAYWKYYNFEKDHDTTETGIRAVLSFYQPGWYITNKSDINVSGAGNEWMNELKLNADLSGVKLNSSFIMEQLWPDVFQRFYYANNYDYSLPSFQKQNRISFKNEAIYKYRNFNFILTHHSVLLKNNYLLDPTTMSWSDSSLSDIRFHMIALRIDWNWKILTLQPEYAFTYNSGNLDFIPEHQLKTRILIKGAVFKSRKMITFIGTDLIAFSSARQLGFVPSLDTYMFDQTLNYYSGLFNLHLFGGFQIDEFRFFVRYENIGYLWNDKLNELTEGYPIPSGILKMGLTWDFFN